MLSKGGNSTDTVATAATVEAGVAVDSVAGADVDKEEIPSDEYRDKSLSMIEIYNPVNNGKHDGET
jgi:hypothetical protein